MVFLCVENRMCKQYQTTMKKKASATHPSRVVARGSVRRRLNSDGWRRGVRRRRRRRVRVSDRGDALAVVFRMVVVKRDDDDDAAAWGLEEECVRETH